MGPDIRDRLKDAALEPSFDIDVDALHARARRTQVRRVAAAAAISIVALVAGAALVIANVGLMDPAPPVLGPGDEVEERDVDEEQQAELERERLEARLRAEERRAEAEAERARHADRWEYGSADDEEMMARIVDLASDHTADPDLPFADEVELGLGSELHATRTREELTDSLERARFWQLDVDEFRGHDGPFSFLSFAADAQYWEGFAVTVGGHPRCTSPPTDPPDELEDLRRVNLHPTVENLDSCDDWWMLSLYVTTNGEIAAATLDLWEP